jgi:chromosome segregation ATPase
VIDLLRGADEVGSQARLKFRKKGTLKTTYEVTLWRCDMSRVREVATLYQLTEEQIKNPNKALAQKVADKVAAVERLDFYLLGAAFQHVAALEELIRRTSEAQCKKDKKTADVILQMQALLDAIQAKGDDVDSVDQSPTGNLSHVSPKVKDRLSEVYESSLVPDAAALQRDVDLLEAEMADAQKANKALKRTISELEHKLEETESKLTHFMHLQGQDKWTGDNDVESMRKENTRLESELKQAKLKIQELDSIGKRLLEQKNPQKEQSSKAVEEMSTKLVAVEERWNDTKKLLKEATKREDELLEKSRIAARTQMTLEAQIQNLTNQLNDSTKALLRKEEDIENLQIVMAKQAKQRDNESRTEKNRDLPREDKIKTCSIGEAQPSLYKLERENEILKSQLDALNHKLELALVEKETLAREMVEMTDHLSEQCCKLEIEKSMRENEELTFRDRLRKEQNHIKDKQAAYEKLEEEMLEVMRELDRQRDLVDEKEDCAAKDITEVVGQLNERHQEQMERMVSEREHLKKEIRAHDAEKDNLNDVIRRLELQLKEAQKEKELNMSAVEQRLHSKFHVERGKLEEEVQRKQQLCTEQIRMMESLVASARLEATAEIATGRNERAEIEKELRSSADRCEASLLCIDHLTKEKTVLQGEIKMLNEKRLEANAEITKERHQHKETEKQLRQLIDRCESERECVENLSKEKIVLQGEIKALTEKLEGACNQTFDAEKEIHAAKARHREQIELLEGEIRKIRGAERNLEMKVDEVQRRLDEADKILKESMQLVNATTPLALPRMVAALQKDAEKIVLQGEIKALTEKLEGACKQALDAEKEVQATKARHREQIELLESETRKVRGAERNLEMKVDEVQLRLDEADKILKESMQLVNATTPLALPLRITALQNEAAVQNSSEHENLNARAKKAESMLGELSEILNAPDLVSLPHVAVQMGKQRHSLKNAQVQLEEEVLHVFGSL